jgi:DUF4097 and DUF4098 domain-containing protein YvlB
MRTKLLPPALAAATLLLGGCDIEDFHGGARYNSDFHYSYPMSAKGKLTVETFNGSVEISGWDQDTVDISGTKYARTQDLADALKVDIDHSPNAVSIRVPRPSLGPHNEGVRFVIKAPRTAVLDRVASSNGAIRVADAAGPARLKTSNGAITVHGLRGSLDAQTSNGRITAELDTATGPVRVETSNGPVELRLPSKFDDDVRVHTSNGGITVRAPADLNARVSARTSNGKITSDLDLRAQGEISRHRLDGVIGAGGPLLDLNTSNGGIHITR